MADPTATALRNVPARGDFNAIRYRFHCCPVIKGCRHKGLERFFRSGSKDRSQAHHTGRLRLILARLHAASAPEDMDLPGLDLHRLSGDRKGTWSVQVSGNGRITFVFDDGDAYVVDYEDDH